MACNKQFENLSTKIYLVNEYYEGSIEDINIMGAFSSFEKAEEVAKSLLQKWHDESLAQIAKTGVYDNEWATYYICSCDFDGGLPGVNYFEHEVRWEKPAKTQKMIEGYDSESDE